MTCQDILKSLRKTSPEKAAPYMHPTLKKKGPRGTIGPFTRTAGGGYFIRVIFIVREVSPDFTV